ncbi:MAG: magnesium-dependent phosphatase-1 [Candidatus Hydrothermarchaeota archaeon]
MIRAVIFDADGTLWKGESFIMRPPFEKISDNAIKDPRGREVVLFEGIRELLDFLNEKKVFIGLAAQNFFDTVFEILDLFGIQHYFTEEIVIVDWATKVMMFDKILASDFLLKNGLEPENIAFVDDNESENLIPVKRKYPGIKTILANENLSHIQEIIELVSADF